MTEPLTPPGHTTEIRADRVLVLAPHHDDEVLGCGGLLGQLTTNGATARVLFLSDSGGSRQGEERRAYTDRRRRESQAAGEVLGISAALHLDLPDGHLAQHLDVIVESLRSELIEHPPELVLVPSALEASADHRATFRAVHELFGRLRPDGDLWSLARGLRILTWELNRPQFPDLLVDIDSQVDRLRQAMACYESQQEQHDYLGACLGLARFRTLTLPNGTEHAEAYRELRSEDFTRRGVTHLIEHLGGVVERLRVEEGPQISVIVRTLNRPTFLSEALASLASSSWGRTEVLVVNDGGRPPELPTDFPLTLERLDLPENVGRSAAANAGIAAAKGDYIAFLDDDDLVEPEHLEILAGLVGRRGVRVAYTDAAVGIYEFETGGFELKERRLPYSRDFDRDLLFFDNYIPFNTLLIETDLAREVGDLDPELPFFEDWDFLLRLAEHTDFQHLAQVTCEYRQFRGGGHHILGDSPRERADFLDRKAEIITRHRGRWNAQTLARVVDRLRGETVSEQDEAARMVDELRSHYGLNGRIQSLERHAEALEAAERRAREGEHEALARKNELDQTLGQTYSEIERLNGLIREMEATTAWRWHGWWQRVKPWGSSR